MMKYWLDTNVCIDAMRGRQDVVAKLKSMSPDDCTISTISMFELEVGACKSSSPSKELGKVAVLFDTLLVLPWNNEAAKSAAKIRSDLEVFGRKIGVYDTLIAGHAVALGLVLITNNLKEFSRVDGLVVENWRDK